MDRRKQKIEKVIQNELGRIFLKNLRLPPGTLITIVNINVSSGHQHARVYLSIFPDRLRARTFELLNQHIYKFQKLLDKRLLIRPVPKIRFVLDEGGDRFSRINKLLKG